MEKEILKLAEHAAEGRTNPLHAYIALKRIEKVLTDALELVHPIATDFSARYGQKSFEDFGAAIEISEMGVKYEFENCGDVKWEKLDSQLKSVADAKKEREVFLKSLREKTTLLHEETGEVIEVYPAVKKSKTGLKIKLKDI